MNEPLNEMREFMITPTTTTKNENNKQKKKNGMELEKTTSYMREIKLRREEIFFCFVCSKTICITNNGPRA